MVYHTPQRTNPENLMYHGCFPVIERFSRVRTPTEKFISAHIDHIRTSEKRLTRKQP